MAESATFALKAGVWFRRGRLLIVSPDSLGTACPLSGRNSTYRPVQILAAGSLAGRQILHSDVAEHRDGAGSGRPGARRGELGALQRRADDQRANDVGRRLPITAQRTG